MAWPQRGVGDVTRKKYICERETAGQSDVWALSCLKITLCFICGRWFRKRDDKAGVGGLSERILRSHVVGHKTWYGTHSRW